MQKCLANRYHAGLETEEKVVEQPDETLSVPHGKEQEKPQAAADAETSTVGEDSYLEGADGKDTEKGSDSYTRQKLRKTVTSGTPIQLAVDLHNEGIVVHYRSADSTAENPPPLVPSGIGARSISSPAHGQKGDGTDGNLPKGADKAASGEGEKEGSGLPSGGKWSSGSGGGRSEFIAWGIRARQLLYSIVCGEVPRGYAADKIDSDGKGLLQGGQIKCTVRKLL